VFDAVEERVQLALDAGSDARKRVRNDISTAMIENLRYVLMLLAREETLKSEQARKIVTKLARLQRIHRETKDVLQLFLLLRKFLVMDLSARSRLRKVILPHHMGSLQKMLKAVETEEEYTNYVKMQELFQSINI
jgi:hypothetical protein